jgi:hypothetical protein
MPAVISSDLPESTGATRGDGFKVEKRDMAVK